jgi:glycosyltransferase involved in cell wall biosynthesis
MTNMNIKEAFLNGISIVIPVFNEERSIGTTVVELLKIIPENRLAELIIVDDGSNDETAKILSGLVRDNPKIRVIAHPLNRGYGAALKSGILVAKHDIIIISDADGTYPNYRIPELLEGMDFNDMVVGARTTKMVSYPLVKKIPKLFLRAWIMYLTWHNVPDFNSGLRIFHKKVAMDCWHLLPNGFSFTTTITMYSLFKKKNVKFIPIDYFKRDGKSKIDPLKDTCRFILIIGKLGLKLAPHRMIYPLVVLVIVVMLAVI